mmetsp:Transcript_90621/g.189513  ORF Transcript_90621/g.189513 Transcript_90621/m.189513 type:complete len:495 (+) Transcript_90621:57-1541(+)
MPKLSIMMSSAESLLLPLPWRRFPVRQGGAKSGGGKTKNNKSQAASSSSSSSLDWAPQAAAALAASAVCAGLWAQKALHPPAEKAAWWNARSIHGAAIPSEAAREQELLGSLSACGLRWEEELKLAATRSWSGVEFAIESLVASNATKTTRTLCKAIERWRALGALEIGARTNLRPENSLSVGKDVGVSAPTYLGRPEGAVRLTKEKEEEAFQRLDQDGIVLLRDLVDLEGIRALRKKLRLSAGSYLDTESQHEFACPRHVASGDLLAASKNVELPPEPSIGRRHLLIRGTELSEEFVQPLLAPLMPLLYRYFNELRPQGFPACLNRFDEPGSSSASCPPRPFVAVSQILITNPGSVHQIWHRDNRHPGLTILLPLTDIDDEVGPTQLIPGTHRLVTSGRGASLLATFSSFFSAGGAVAAAPAGAGDALLYDSRLLHRGMANSSYTRCRAVVAVRVDFDDTPPPGSTTLQLQVAKAEGRLLHLLGTFYRSLPTF